MPLLNTPLRFEPFLRPMVWGGRLLETLGKRLPKPEPYGESWEVSDHPVARSVIAEGLLAGTTLRFLMEKHRGELLGPLAEKYQVFPWLFKFLDAHDWLSVQVHPDAASVQRLWPGEGPKNEAWFILQAQPGSAVYAGLLPGVGKPDLLAALERGAVAQCLHRFEPRPGDFLYLSAGTVHAVGGGVLMAEIQQTSDATFRLFDWNRVDGQGKLRQLHIEQSLASIDWIRGPVRPLPIAALSDGDSADVSLAETPYFHLRFIRNSGTLHFGGQGRLQALCVFAGRGRWSTGQEVLPGQVWLLPAAVPPVSCRPEPSLAGMLCDLV